MRNNNHRYYKPHKNFNTPKAQAPEQVKNDTAATAAVTAPEVKEVVEAEYDAPAYVAEDDKEQISEPVPCTEIVGVQFRRAGKVYYFSPSGISFDKGDAAIVETVRGVEFANVVTPNKLVPDSQLVMPLKAVMRKATPDDFKHDENNRKLEQSAVPVFNEKVAANKLAMRLVDVEYTFDNAKLIFYFSADGRVDFRELVKDLASVFRTRIELRQIGVRDEARLYGGLGVCGRPFCCKTFLQDFTQVSIKMAKEQNLSLSSSKISGTCGRLMCCLRFESEVYEIEYANFPKVDNIVETPAGRGVIIESNFLTGNIKVKMNGTQNDIKTYQKNDLKVVGTVKSHDENDAELKKLEDN